MEVKQISDKLSLSEQLQLTDIPLLAEQGFRSIICNRPDGEGADQPTCDEIKAAATSLNLEVRYLPVVPGQVRDSDVAEFGNAMRELPKPTLAYCRTGTRSATLWSLSQAATQPVSNILSAAKAAGYDMSGAVRRIANGGKTPTNQADASYDIVIVGAGAAGIAVASSLLKRQSGLQIAIVDPADVHYYQPGWTMVGGGIFEPEDTAKTMGSLIPNGVDWLKTAVTAFEPKTDSIILEGCRVIKYTRLIVCPGLKLDWHKIEGLTDTLGRHGVTSNYRYDLAPYTWSLVQTLKTGNAIFSQPPMPIKCAGAPQKALYLSGDYWYRKGLINDINISFNNAGGVLFGVKEYVPALQNYMERYQASLNYFHNLVAVDGPAGKAWFDVSVPDEPVRTVEAEFDMLHVCPPQCAPDFIKVSELSDSAGWIDVEQTTLRHKTHTNIWALGDVTNAPNAKTAAAARKQAPVVAANVVADIHGKSPVASYDGYGSCPLTVERGKIVLAEFGYGGKLLPSFPSWLIDGTKPNRAAWFLKEKLLPPIYWKAMLRGHEWMAEPQDVVVKST
jgi:sulfide:quinone oxidoreductase